MADRIAIRCDGDKTIGAGHVGRCLPIADALRRLGSDVQFVGSYADVASWMLDEWGFASVDAGIGPCGVDAHGLRGAIVDLYLPEGPGAVCDLAALLPVATLGEATRCTDAGLWIDYHAGAPAGRDERRLGGPEYVPVDRRLIFARGDRSDVERILVMAGGSQAFTEICAGFADAAAAAFPAAEVLAPEHVGEAARAHVRTLPTPVRLAELAAEIDLAIAPAGMTAYELATAGICVVAVALVENQRVVIDGCRATGFALGIDGIDRDPVPEVRAALAQLHDPATRLSLSQAACATLDGLGAERIASELLARWR